MVLWEGIKKKQICDQALNIKRNLEEQGKNRKSLVINIKDLIEINFQDADFFPC